MANWRSNGSKPIRRVIVLMLDGLEPALVDHYLEQGLLHYLALLSDIGMRNDWQEPTPVDLGSWRADFEEHRVRVTVLPMPRDANPRDLNFLAAADRKQQENLFAALSQTRSCVVVAVFDMAKHLQQLLAGEADDYQKQVIRDVYARMDEIVGKAFSFVDASTVLVVAAASRAGGILFANRPSEALISSHNDLPRLVLRLLSIDSAED